MNGTTPAATSVSLPPAREIPATFVASVRSWWVLWVAGEKESASAEERLLRRLPFFRSGSSSSLPSSNEPVVAHSEKVLLDNPKHFLNTLAMKPTSTAPNGPPPAVLLHGYGAGLGFFFLNFPALAQWAGTRGSAVYAVDWLGMGRSARVPFRVKASRDNTAERVREAEAFFIDSLEQWRARMGLETMTLVGHSLGAYFSVAYALRYPARVSKLVLLSPAGVPRDPNNTTMPAREITESQMSGTEDGQAASGEQLGALKKEQKAEKRKESKASRLFTYLWEEGWSPFQVVRSAVFWGPMLVGKYSSRRFGALNEDDTRDMHDYITNITLAKGSGEYCISHILAPGAHARMPLVDRIAELKIPITFVYGEHDWMDPDGGVASIDNLKAAGNNDGRMYIIPLAGHHVYLDNAKAVNKLLLKELDFRGR
ncbi:alpha/beta-hydrolase [Auriscalpium vulgare]|uniref:Alpha/beta-hydrolase n=1 Tax=Auriscalpium vulgare TaxID=40419 RepID=A0ACB8RSQ9_9AGAM|nr:alpha/beta-hydrolase [Auriscalpium vulgare]